jgi:hypothetical protein
MRVVWMLATSGYAIQALTAAATMFENGFRLAYVTMDSERARRYWDHVEAEEDVPTKSHCAHCGRGPTRKKRRRVSPPWENVRTCVDEVTRRYETDVTPGRSYAMYQELCRAKHSEAEFLRFLGERVDRSRNVARHLFGPSKEPVDIYYCAKAVQVSLYAANVMCSPLVAKIGVNELREFVDDCQALTVATPATIVRPFFEAALTHDDPGKQARSS